MMDSNLAGEDYCRVEILFSLAERLKRHGGKRDLTAEYNSAAALGPSYGVRNEARDQAVGERLRIPSHNDMYTDIRDQESPNKGVPLEQIPHRGPRDQIAGGHSQFCGQNRREGGSPLGMGGLRRESQNAEDR